jgi:hypothetical protein
VRNLDEDRHEQFDIALNTPPASIRAQPPSQAIIDAEGESFMAFQAAMTGGR